MIVILSREQNERTRGHVKDHQKSKSVPLTSNVLGRSFDDDAISYLSVGRERYESELMIT